MQLRTIIFITIVTGLLGVAKAQQPGSFTVTGNPLISSVFTADPAALVYKDSVYLYAGHDEAPANRDGYVMNEWLVFSSADMIHWNTHPVPLKVTNFAWAKADAWASQVIERNGKFYWYAAVEHATQPGKAIAVAVSDLPTGPFVDAKGAALITNEVTNGTTMMWDDIDPSVIIDAGGQAYLFWGNNRCYYAKLAANMIELDGPIKTISLPNYTEAPWIHYRKGWYYLSYATGFPEKIAYAMSRNINGPWQYKGILNEVAGNSNTNHQSIIEFKGKWYFIYHNGTVQPSGGSFRRSVCAEPLRYKADGTIQRIVMSTEGITTTNKK